jgi:hypothetical protein
MKGLQNQARARRDLTCGRGRGFFRGGGRGIDWGQGIQMPAGTRNDRHPGRGALFYVRLGKSVIVINEGISQDGHEDHDTQ